MTLQRSIMKAYRTASERNWDTIYCLVDCHDTIACSNYRDAEVSFYPQALEALREISWWPEIQLVLWTCSYPADTARLVDRLAHEGVRVRGVNRTPIANTVTGCFDEKPYFSILIDDKAGFCPEEWPECLQAFRAARSEYPVL